TVGIDDQVAVQALNHRAHATGNRGRGVAAGAHTDDQTARSRTIGTRLVVSKDVAAGFAAFFDIANIRVGLRHIVRHVNVDIAVSHVAVAVHGMHSDLFVVDRAVALIVGLGTVERVAVGHFPGDRVIGNNSKGAARWQCGRLRRSDRHAILDHVDAANGQGLQTVRRRDLHGAGLGQRRGVRAAAVGQVGF
nr:hypothetical protein [Tanacetum cinerariifolium]